VSSYRSKRGRWTMRVAYQDTDQARVVHHAAYFRYLEVGRVEFWREQGLDYNAFEKGTGLGLPVAEARVRYRMAARFDDRLEIETWVARASRASVWFDAVIRRGHDVVHEASVRLACVNMADGAIRKIPDVLLEACLEPGFDV
jgi:acyl-CoA thioester hydrolase